MASYRTPNVGLNKWSETDYFKRVEINENFDKIDDQFSKVDDKIGILLKSKTNWINVKEAPYNAKGDGVTDDTQAINQAIQDCFNAGGGVVYFPNATYVIKRRIAGDHSQGGILLKSGVSLLGDNATLLLRDNCAFIKSEFPTTTTEATITADVTYGATTVTVDTTTGFNVDDEVHLRIGDNAWDVNETRYTLFAKIKSIPSETSIELDRPILEDMTVANTDVKNRKITKLNNVIRNTFIHGFKLINDINNGGVAESGIDLRYTQNMSVSNIEGEHVGAGLLIVAYSTELHAKNLRVTKCIKQNGHTAKGRVVNIWNSANCLFENVRGEDFETAFLMAESYNRNIKFRNVHIVNNNISRVNSKTDMFAVLQGSEVHFEDITIQGNGGFPLVGQGGTTGNNYTFTNLTLQTVSHIKGGLETHRLRGTFRYYNPSTNTENVFNMDKLYERELTVTLADNMYSTFYLPKGLWITHFITYSSNIVVGDVEALYIGRESQNGANQKSTAESNIGTEVTVRKWFGSDYATELKYGEKTKIIVDGAATGLTGNNKTVTIRVLFADQIT